MKLLRKDEAFALREQGFNKYIKKSASKHPKYYAVENPRVLDALDSYRKSKVVEEYTR